MPFQQIASSIRYSFLKKMIPQKIQEKSEADKLNDCQDLAEYIYTTCNLSNPQNIEALQEKDINNLLAKKNPAGLLEALKKLGNNGIKLTIENVTKVIAIDLDTLNGVLAILEEYNFSQPEGVEAILEHNDPAELLEVLNTLAESLCLTAENFRAVMFTPDLETFKATLNLFKKYSCLELEYVRVALIEKDPAKLLKVLNTLKESPCLTAENLMDCMRIKNLSTFDETLNILKNYNCLKPEYLNTVLTQTHPAQTHPAELLKVLNTLKESLCLTEENLRDVICTEDFGTFEETLNILKNHDCLKPGDVGVNKILTQNDFAELLLKLQELDFLNTENVKAVVAMPRNSDLFPDKILTLCKKHKYLADKVTDLLKHDDHLGVLQRLEVLEKHGFLNTENIQAAAAISKNNDLDLDNTLRLFEKCDCLTKDVTDLLKHGNPVKISNRLGLLEKYGFLDTKNAQTAIGASEKIDLNLGKLLTLFKKYNCLKIDLTPVLKHDDPARLFQKLNSLAEIGLLNAATVQAVAAADDIDLVFDAISTLFKRHNSLKVDLTAVLKPDNTDKLSKKLAELGITDEAVEFKPVIAAIINLTLDLLKQSNCLELKDVNAVLTYGDPPGLLEGLQTLKEHDFLNAANIQRIMAATKPLVKALLLVFINQGKQKDVEATLKEPGMQRLENVLSKLYDKRLLTPETWTIVFATYPRLENFNDKLDDPNFTGVLQELKSAELLKCVNILAAMVYTNSNFCTQLSGQRYFPGELNQDSLNSYAHKITRETPSIFADSDCLNMAIETTRKSTLPKQLPSFETTTLPFAIDEKLFSTITTTLEKRVASKKDTLAQAQSIETLWDENGKDTATQKYSDELQQGLLELFKGNELITKPLKQEFSTQEEHDFSKELLPVVIQMGLEKKIAAGKTELAQELFTQAVWLEGRVGKETQRYLTDLSPKLEPVLRAAFKKYKIDTDLLDKKRIVFYENESFPSSEETLEAATKYYSHEEVPLVAGAEKIVAEVENTINTLSALQPSEARLCEAICKYAEAANQDPALENPIKFILWEIKTRLLIDLKSFEDVKELLQESDIAKLLDDKPPSCYLWHKREESINAEAQKENSNNTLANNSDTEYLAADGSFTNETGKQHRVAEEQQRKENILLKRKFESLQKDNKTVQAENESLKENILLLEGGKASLEQGSSLMQENCKALQVKNSSLEEANMLLLADYESLKEKLASSESEKTSLKEKVLLEGEWGRKKRNFKDETNKELNKFTNYFKNHDNGQIPESVTNIKDRLKIARDQFTEKLQALELKNPVNDYEQQKKKITTDFVSCLNDILNSETSKNLTAYHGGNSVLRKLLVVFANAAIALTGIGLIPLSGQLIYSKLKHGRASFFFEGRPKPKAQQRVDEVHDKFKQEATNFTLPYTPS